VKYVVRDFPLSFHPHAQKTAEATECADDQGKFWEMHDKIFETQATWSSATDIVPVLKQYAADLKLNTGTFNTCLDSSKYKDEVAKDMADGSATHSDRLLSGLRRSTTDSNCYPKTPERRLSAAN
jgi:protein-disulfide isomerase